MLGAKRNLSGVLAMLDIRQFTNDSNGYYLNSKASEMKTAKKCRKVTDAREDLFLKAANI